MNTIRRVALAIAMALIFAAGVNAQDSCRVKVVVAEVNWDGSGEPKFGRITSNQIEWRRREGQKKFPGICLTSDKNKDAFEKSPKFIQKQLKWDPSLP